MPEDKPQPSRKEAADRHINNQIKNYKAALRAAEFLVPHQAYSSGHFGYLYLCTYLGSDPLIKKICTADKKVLVKMRFEDLQYSDAERKVFAENDIKEDAITNEIEEKRQHAPTENVTQLCPTRKIEVGGYNFLIITPIFADIDADKLPEDQRYGANLQVDLYNAFEYMRERNWPEAINLEQFAKSARSALSQLHALGYLHGDVSLRNFLIKEFPDRDELMLCDYGHSCPIVSPPEVRALRSPAPIFHSNYDTLSGSQVKTIAVDLYGFRICLLAMVGMAAGALNEREAICYPGDLPRESPEYRKAAVAAIIEEKQARFNFESRKSDSDSFKFYYQNVMQRVNALPDSLYKNSLIVFIDKYYEYILQMPSTDDLQQGESVQDADARFFREITHRKD